MIFRVNGKNLERKRRNKFRSNQKSHQITRMKELRVKTDRMTSFMKEERETETVCLLAEGNNLRDLRAR